MDIPKFVKIKGSSCALRLDDEQFYRDAGVWGVSYQIRDNRVYINEPKGIASHLHNKELIECSEEEYLEDNKGYV